MPRCIIVTPPYADSFTQRHIIQVQSKASMARTWMVRTVWACARARKFGGDLSAQILTGRVPPMSWPKSHLRVKPGKGVPEMAGEVPPRVLSLTRMVRGAMPTGRSILASRICVSTRPLSPHGYASMAARAATVGRRDPVDRLLNKDVPDIAVSERGRLPTGHADRPPRPGGPSKDEIRHLRRPWLPSGSIVG
jgi:hypothetical protein